jgi:hypothetical protein
MTFQEKTVNVDRCLAGSKSVLTQELGICQSTDRKFFLITKLSLIILTRPIALQIQLIDPDGDG